ncbi:head GIN domain-containing protein [Flavobacterium sp.]|uniref:head GIN domain-containing protein n=1 Tax=Flavobacterium sp. TaxID=239 RepID=UPI00286EA21D|nr:head GIN domain-containing protein [Flavobacterium sp.]
MIKIITIITKFIVATLMALLFSSCNSGFNIGDGIKGSGNITTETRPAIQDFKSIEVSQGIKVNVEQADTKSITVEADDNLQEHIITKIENGVLKIESDKSYNSTETPVVNVKIPVVNGLSASSGSEINSSTTLVSTNINAKSSSGSRINIEVEADAITLESTSGSNIEASGKALKLETTSSSGSSIDAKDLMANEVIAQTTSGSSTSVYPILKLDANASSGSSIDYHKVPKTLAKEESSGGSVSEN